MSSSFGEMMGSFFFAGEIMGSLFFLAHTHGLSFAEEVNKDKIRPLLAHIYTNVYMYMHLCICRPLLHCKIVGH